VDEADRQVPYVRLCTVVGFTDSVTSPAVPPPVSPVPALTPVILPAAAATGLRLPGALAPKTNVPPLPAASLHVPLSVAKEMRACTGIACAVGETMFSPKAMVPSGFSAARPTRGAVCAAPHLPGLEASD
jgi:hypothetical protein